VSVDGVPVVRGHERKPKASGVPAVAPWVTERTVTDRSAVIEPMAPSASMVTGPSGRSITLLPSTDNAPSLITTCSPSTSTVPLIVIFAMVSSCPEA